MAAPKVAWIRRPDHWRSYDIWQPLSENADVDGQWVRWGFQCPWWDAANQTAAPEYQYLLSLVSCTAGVVRPCWFATKANSRLTEGGAWSAAAENAAGTYSGHIYRYATVAGRTVSCKLPANADLVVVRYPPNTVSGAVIAVAIDDVDQPTLGFTTATGGTSNRITDHVFSVTPDASDRVLKLTISSFTATQFTLIAILCYDTDGVADPRELDATDGLARGNRHVELYYNLTGAASLQSVAAFGSGSVSHIPVRAYYGSYIMKKPNTTHLTIQQNNGGSANSYWTADNSPHWDAAPPTSDNPYTPTAVPTVTMDGVSPGDVFDTGVCGYSVLFEKDSIVIRGSGTCGAAGDGVTTLTYVYAFTTDCLALGSKLLFDETAAAANAVVTVIYLPSWTLNMADASTLLEVQSGYFMVPNDSTKYACGSDNSISSSTCDIYIDGVPYMVSLTTSGPESKIETNSTAATATKFYVSLGACPSLETIDDQVTWSLGGTIRVRRRPFGYWGGAKG